MMERYDIKVNNTTAIFNGMGHTCDKAWAFIRKKEGSVPRENNTYVYPAKDFAAFLAKEDIAVLNDEGRADFPELDYLHEDSFLHFETEHGKDLTEEEKVNGFNNAEILFGIRLSENDKVKIKII